MSGRFLTFEEREDIALELAKGSGIRAIARKLGRSPSSISREVRRNAATRSGNLDYKASTAQWHADRAAQRPKQGKLTTNAALRHYVQDRLAGKVTHSGWSGLPWTGCGLEGAAGYPPSKPTLVNSLEP